MSFQHMKLVFVYLVTNVFVDEISSRSTGLEVVPAAAYSPVSDSPSPGRSLTRRNSGLRNGNTPARRAVNKLLRNQDSDGSCGSCSSPIDNASALKSDMRIEIEREDEPTVEINGPAPAPHAPSPNEPKPEGAFSPPASKQLKAVRSGNQLNSKQQKLLEERKPLTEQITCRSCAEFVVAMLVSGGVIGYGFLDHRAAQARKRDGLPANLVSEWALILICCYIVYSVFNWANKRAAQGEHGVDSMV